METPIPNGEGGRILLHQECVSERMKVDELLSRAETLL